MTTKQKTTTESAWDELCAAADARVPEAAKARMLPTAGEHPFRATLGPGPYHFSHFAKGEDKCAHCGKRITNVYHVQVGDFTKVTKPLGSECILKLTHQSTIQMVMRVKREKRFQDKVSRQARERARDAAEASAARKDSLAAHPAEAAWLASYKGTFEFYLSLRAQFERNGYLSENQWASLTKAVARENAPKVARTFTIAAGAQIIVSKWAGQKIAREAGCKRPHYGMEVMEVLNETERAYQLTLKLAAVRSSRCCVCGLTLTNIQSIAEGIGPICGERWEVVEGDALEQLAAKLRTFSVVTTWLPKSAIKERK